MNWALKPWRMQATSILCNHILTKATLKNDGKREVAIFVEIFYEQPWTPCQEVQQPKTVIIAYDYQ